MADTITPERLRQHLVDDAVTLVDTRDPESYESWHIPGSVNVPFTPGDDVDADVLLEDVGTSEDDSIVTICAKGISSYEFADTLGEAGIDDVHVVQDGMEGWSRVYTVASVPTAVPSLEIFQIQRVAKGCLGYVIGSPHTGEAVVVDPTRHTNEFKRIAEDDGMTITHVLDTHIHADHISGGRELADEVGATYHLPAGARERDVSYDFAPLERNEVLTIGDLELKAIYTPGHTGEFMSVLVAADAILTGDTLFVDGVGRTELEFGEEGAREGARQLYESIHGSILNLPDSIAVLPGHVDTEEPEVLASTGAPFHTPIKRVRTEVPILRQDKAAFIEQIGRADSETPPNYEEVIAINAGNASPDEEEASELELGPNRCAAAAD